MEEKIKIYKKQNLELWKACKKATANTEDAAFIFNLVNKENILTNENDCKTATFRGYIHQS